MSKKEKLGILLQDENCITIGEIKSKECEEENKSECTSGYFQDKKEAVIDNRITSFSSHPESISKKEQEE